MKYPVLVLLVLISSVTSAERPNILLLMAEDLSPRVGAFGDPVAVTPNLDRLAEEGVRYTKVFAAAGVCAPSRAAFILGMHQVTTGSQHMRTSTRPAGPYFAVPPENIRAFPELLRREGYYTYTDTKLDYQFSGVFAGTGPFTIWDAEEVESRGWRDRDAGQPFFGWRNLLITHESGVFPPLGNWPHSRRHFMMQLYRWWRLGTVEQVVSPDDVILPPYYPDTSTARDDLARHYNNIAVMDQQIGTILQRLEQDGLADSTIVIWTTDHGDGLPRAKRELHDSGIRIPMIVRWPAHLRPEGAQPGTVDKRLISAVDFAPTILAIAGAEIPEYLPGISFTDSEREYVFASRDRIDAILDRQRSVRSGRYRYIRSWHPDLAEGHELAFRDNIPMVREMRDLFEAGQLNKDQARWFEPAGEERLYDLERDPHELKDLAQDPAHGSVLQRLRKALDEYRAKTGDLSSITETEMVDRFQTWPEQPRTAPPTVQIEDCTLTLAPATIGSSIGYRVQGDRWRLYTVPLDHCDTPVEEAKAVRYGWQASESVAIM